MNEQEIRAKALEIAMLFLGPTPDKLFDGEIFLLDNMDKALMPYLALARQFERYIRQDDPDKT